MSEDVQLWQERKGVDFLRKVGLRPGHRVLDFGCGSGHYTIPAAKLVGASGLVYAVDKSENTLNTLKQNILKYGLTNVRIRSAFAEGLRSLQAGWIDAALFYDVLHYLDEAARKELYRQMHRILGISGVFSVYLKHTADDDPAMEFRNLYPDQITRQIEQQGYALVAKYCGRIMHDDYLTDGCVLNFKKTVSNNKQA